MPESVCVTSSVMGACWAHCLSTETEEVMGLLLGHPHPQGPRVLSLRVCRRLTKQKDRVEVDPDSLTKATEEAERLGVRVLGWYHSHPHITVHPSHVDLATQMSYQTYIDKDFVGLIFSVFNYDPVAGVDTKEVIAFQTEEGNECKYININITLPDPEWIPVVNEAFFSLSGILQEEELNEFSAAENGSDIASVYNGSVLTGNLCQIYSLVTEPSLQASKVLKEAAEATTEALQQRKKELEEFLEAMEKDVPSSDESKDMPRFTDTGIPGRKVDRKSLSLSRVNSLKNDYGKGNTTI